MIPIFYKIYNIAPKTSYFLIESPFRLYNNDFKGTLGNQCFNISSHDKSLLPILSSFKCITGFILSIE